MTVDDIAVVFSTLRAGGLRPLFKHDDDILEAMRVWAQILADCSREELMTAAVNYLRQPASFYWPVPGQLLALVPRYQVDVDSDGRWGEVLGLVRRHGHYSPPRRPGTEVEGDEWTVDEATWRGIQACGGWRELCMVTRDTMAAQRAAFRSAYESAGERSRKQIQQRAASALLTAAPQLKVVG